MKRQKVILVTGSTRGIGYAIAKKYADNGFSIVLNSAKSELTGEKLVKAWSKQGVKCIYIKADISQRSKCEKLFKDIKRQFGGIDVLVNNAGTYKPQHKMTDQEKDRMFQVKLNGMQYCSDLAIEAGVKSIISISSVYATQPSFPSLLASALQSGVENMTKSYAREYAGKVQVNCVAPGYVDTTLTENGLSKKYRDSIIKKIPTRRLIKPEEIAEAVYFLYTMPAIIGQVLVVDGGYILTP